MRGGLCRTAAPPAEEVRRRRVGQPLEPRQATDSDDDHEDHLGVDGDAGRAEVGEMLHRPGEDPCAHRTEELSAIAAIRVLGLGVDH